MKKNTRARLLVLLFCVSGTPTALYCPEGEDINLDDNDNTDPTNNRRNGEQGPRPSWWERVKGHLRRAKASLGKLLPTIGKPKPTTQPVSSRVETVQNGDSDTDLTPKEKEALKAYIEHIKERTEFLNTLPMETNEALENKDIQKFAKISRTVDNAVKSFNTEIPNKEQSPLTRDLIEKFSAQKKETLRKILGKSESAKQSLQTLEKLADALVKKLQDDIKNLPQQQKLIAQYWERQQAEAAAERAAQPKLTNKQYLDAVKEVLSQPALKELEDYLANKNTVAETEVPLFVRSELEKTNQKLIAKLSENDSNANAIRKLVDTIKPPTRTGVIKTKMPSLDFILKQQNNIVELAKELGIKVDLKTGTVENLASAEARISGAERAEKLTDAMFADLSASTPKVFGAPLDAAEQASNPTLQALTTATSDVEEALHTRGFAQSEDLKEDNPTTWKLYRNFKDQALALRRIVIGRLTTSASAGERLAKLKTLQTELIEALRTAKVGAQAKANNTALKNFNLADIQGEARTAFEEYQKRLPQLLRSATGRTAQTTALTQRSKAIENINERIARYESDAITNDQEKLQVFKLLKDMKTLMRQ